MQRYFSEQNFSGTTLNLPEDVYKHAVVVMRMKAGSKFELVTPDKVVHVMELVTIDSAKKQAVAHECERFEHQVELPVEATIVCGLPKNDKTDLIVMKATELGVSKIVFFAGDWSVARWAKQKQAKKLERLQKIAKSAAEQSHRTTIPEVSYLDGLEDLLPDEDTVGLCAYEESAKAGEKGMLVKVFDVLKTGEKKKVTAVFGPEGGISPKEVELLKKKGFSLAGLGPRIMRAETAPLYFLSALSFALELE